MTLDYRRGATADCDFAKWTDADFAASREGYLKEILESKATLKLVVAGPGTGKTYAFEFLLKSIRGTNNLAITFINELVADLSKRLDGLAESKTFHTFCTAKLHESPHIGVRSDFVVCPPLPHIVSRDFKILGYPISKWSDKFQRLDESGSDLKGYISRANYYNAVHFDDCVYRVVRLFEEKPDEIPTFDLIVIDEYQDFNKLEVALIDQLALKSPVLLVGDDDQALYEFKNASPDFIRHKYLDSSYCNFSLPFCTRCSEVVVEAVRDVVQTAMKLGHLRNRVDKPFFCYLPDKRQDSQLHPRIIHAHCSVHQKRSPYIAKYIAQEIARIPKKDFQDAAKGGHPCALVISPRDIAISIGEYLTSEGYEVDRSEAEMKEDNLLFAFQLLSNDAVSNLAWRIILQERYPKHLRRTVSIAGFKQLRNHVPKEVQEEVLEIVDLFEMFSAGITMDNMSETKLRNFFKESFSRISVATISPQIQEDNEVSVASPAARKIKIVTFEKSKGLQAHHVFIAGLCEGHLPANNWRIKDREVCRFIVALTRTRLQCHLISVGRLYNSWLQQSAFLSWINQRRIEYKEVNKDFFA